MPKCEQIRDWILTDYIDGWLDKKMTGQLEGHLLDCRDCRAFFKEVKDNVSLPFQQISQQPVPAALWTAIKQTIEQKKQASPWANFVDGLKGWLVFPRLVPVFATLAVMLIVGSATINNIHLRQAQDRDQGEYLVSLLAPAGTSAGAETDLGTPIEHYFL
jgi:predicted anti-sigma-YlaC factor YlaD